MKKYLLFALIFSFVATYTLSGQTKKDDIKKLMNIMGNTDQIDQAIDNILPILSQQILSLGDEAEKEELINWTVSESKKLIQQFIDEDLVGIYDKQFTHSEILSLIQFYDSPLGKKLIKTGPEIQKQTLLLMSTKYMPEMQKRISERLR